MLEKQDKASDCYGYEHTHPHPGMDEHTVDTPFVETLGSLISFVEPPVDEEIRLFAWREEEGA